MVSSLLSPIPAPPAAPQRGGLLAAAVPGDQSVRWRSGVVAWPEDVSGWELSQPCSTNLVTYGVQDGDLRPVGSSPFIIRTSTVCPYQSVQEMADRARTRLEAVTSRAIARELWTGQITTADPWEQPAHYSWLNNTPASNSFRNPFLSQPGVTSVGTGLDVLEALGKVEAEVAQRISSGPVLLHVPVALATEAAIALERRGDLLFTPTGAVVVPDYGYPQDVAIVRGSGPVQVWTGPIEVDDAPADVVSREDNRARVWAQRDALYLFDPRTLVSATVS